MVRALSGPRSVRRVTADTGDDSAAGTGEGAGEDQRDDTRQGADDESAPEQEPRRGLQFALRHPQRTSGLIMLAAKSHSAPPERLAQTVVFNAAFRSDYLYWLVTTRFESAMLNLLGMPADVQATLTAEQAAIARRFLEVMHPISLRSAGIFNERREITVLDPDVFRLDRIPAPTLVIHGTRDTLQPFSHGQHSAKNIPGARLVTLERGGHMPVNHLEQIRDEIAAFLKASAPPAT